MEKEIEFVIKPDGTVEIDMIGYHGSGCSQDAQAFIDKLGKSVDFKEKPEYQERIDDEQRNYN